MLKGGKKRKFRVKAWELVLLLLALLFLDATLLRFDHIRMTELRSAVLEADEAGNEEEIAESIAKLKDFVFNNIVVNVVDENGGQKVELGTGTFYLEQSYRRAAEAALSEAEEKISNDENQYGNIYAAANETCRPQAIANGWTWSSQEFINCMLSEIQKYPASENLEDTIRAAIPSTELYRLNFASPAWAPTASGFSILITAVILVWLIGKILVWLFFKIAARVV